MTTTVEKIYRRPRSRDRRKAIPDCINPRSNKYDPDKAIAYAYGAHYTKESDHSPQASRISLIRRARTTIANMSPRDRILDVGAGKQIVEKEYKLAYGNPPGRFITYDISPIPKHALLLGENHKIDHIRGNGKKLSFSDESMDIVISNMTLDFLGEVGLDEVYRVTKPGGRVFANLCFSYLDPPHLQAGDSFWKGYLPHAPVLFKSSREIAPMMIKHGFSVDRIAQGHDVAGVSWWEVDMTKPQGKPWWEKAIDHSIGILRNIRTHTQPTPAATRIALAAG